MRAYTELLMDKVTNRRAGELHHFDRMTIDDFECSLIFGIYLPQIAAIALARI